MKQAMIFCALMVAGVASGQPTPAPMAVLSAPGGRYVFGQISNLRRDQYLLDTQTGRMWRTVCGGEQKDGVCLDNLVMQPVAFVDLTGNAAGLVPR